jgi:hypothetical protein
MTYPRELQLFLPMYMSSIVTQYQFVEMSEAQIMFYKKKIRIMGMYLSMSLGCIFKYLFGAVG